MLDDALRPSWSSTRSRGVRQLGRNIEGLVRRAVVELTGGAALVVVGEREVRDWLDAPAGTRTGIGFVAPDRAPLAVS